MNQRYLNRILIILIFITFVGCKSAALKRSEPPKKPSTTVKSNTVPATNDAEKIIKDAKKYLGTSYKYGGSTKRGIDCSALVQNVYMNQNIDLPRSSKDQSLKGKWIDIKDIIPGDLVFFATQKNSRKITHVGIVTSINGNDFDFIHSSSSKGVIISSLSEHYWYKAYVQARRIL